MSGLKKQDTMTKSPKLKKEEEESEEKEEQGEEEEEEETEEEKQESTVVQNRQKYRLQYWATCSSVRSFACTAHSFACSGLLASLAPSAALTRSLTSLTPSLVGK